MDVPSHGSRRGALGSLAHLVFPGELEAMKLFKHIWLGGGVKPETFGTLVGLYSLDHVVC